VDASISPWLNRGGVPEPDGMAEPDFIKFSLYEYKNTVNQYTYRKFLCFFEAGMKKHASGSPSLQGL